MSHEVIAIALLSILMVIGAVIDGWKLKVPNWLTFPMIIAGWLFWGTAGWPELWISFIGSFAAGGLLLLPYIIGGMGAGDVKLYAGFGAWAVPLPWFGFENLLWAFAISVILGAAMSLVIIWWKGTYFLNLANALEIMSDWKTSSSVGEVASKAKVRKPSLQLLPYGVPLTIGSLCYLASFVFTGVTH